MNRLKFAVPMILASLAVACGGTPPQQANNTQPASNDNTQAQQQPPAQEPPAQQQEPPAQQQQPPAEEPAQPRPVQQRPRASQPAPATASVPAPAPPKPAVQMLDVPAGTVLTLAMDAGVNSKKNFVGDKFTATVLEPITVAGMEAIPAGSKIEGKVTEAVPAKQGAGKGKLSLSFDELSLPSGQRMPISGTFQEVSESKKKRNAAVIGGSAAGGALLGRILGKDTKTTVLGTIVGAGIGTAVVMGQEGEQARLPADTPFEIKLEAAVAVPHPPAKS